MEHEFHWRDDTYFRVTNSGDVDVFRRPKRAAYYTHERGFHDPEEHLFTVDSASWDSIVMFVENARAALSSVGGG